MSAKQDRVAPRTAADIESKYNFGKSFAEVMGLAQDAKKAADEAVNATVGANLLTGTKDFSGSDWHNLNMWSKDGTYKGLTVLSRIGAWQGLKQLFYAEVGETYTVSAYVKSSGMFSFHFCMGNVGSGYATPGTRTYEPISEWTRVSDTFTVTTAGIIAPGYEGNTDSTQLWICGLKLEKGDRATEWCPATVETSVSHESVFNALTDNGKMQGVYRSDDGQIYINASYIKSGKIAADYIDVASLKVDAAQITSGTIEAARIPTLSADKITSGKLSGDKIDGSTLTITKGATIAGWNIDGNSIYKSSGSWGSGTFMCTGSNSAYSIGGSGTISGWVFGAGGKFGVTSAGAVYCSDIHASGGTIGGWSIKSDALYHSSGSNKVYLFPSGPSILTSEIPNGIGTSWYSIVVSAQSYSDRELKENIEAMSNRYDSFFDALVPSVFNYINDQEKKLHFGFIAQDVECALLDSDISNFAGIWEEEHYHLNKQEFVALNTWQIQKLKQRVAALEAKLKPV